MNRLQQGAQFLGVFCLAAVGLAQDIPTARPESVLFEELPVVEAASLHAQTLIEAPASVTVVTEEDIRRRGYRTLAELLGDVRGMYISNDRAYSYVGVRGFSLPGDFNTRLLVMINGHSLTENVHGSTNYFGQDFGLDLDLVKRVEIVRGPSSALYGSNGMFATINIVTKSPVDYEPLRVSAEVDGFGERKAQVSGSRYLGQGVNLLVSVSVFNNAGQSPLYFPAFDNPKNNHGLAVDSDAERGYHTYANLIWNNWSFTAYFNNREKLVPTGWYRSVFNDRGDRVSNGRDFLEAVYQRYIGSTGKLLWRTYYDRSRFEARLDLPGSDGIVDARQVARGDWLGSELSYQFQTPHFGLLTVGGAATWDLQARLLSYYLTPVYLSLPPLSDPDRSVAVFVQDEWTLRKHWTLYLGGRVDDARNHALQLNPRVALIYEPNAATAIKLLYGRSFRSPSLFEQYYQNGLTQIANPGLDSERLQTLEAAFERHLGKKIELQANVYHYRLEDLITAAVVRPPLQQYQNTESSQATGAELEASADFRSGFKVDASLAVQRSPGSAGNLLIVNSPARVGKLLLDAPLFHNRWSVSGGLQYLSERTTLAGASVPAVYLVNLTAASRRLPGDLELQLGIRNLFNHRYWDPAGPVQRMDSIEQDGRSFYVRLSWEPQLPADRAPRTPAAASAPRKEP